MARRKSTIAERKRSSQVTRVASVAGVNQFARQHGIDFAAQSPTGEWFFHSPTGRSTTGLALPRSTVETLGVRRMIRFHA